MAFFDTFSEVGPTPFGWRLMCRLNRYHLEVLDSLAPKAQRIAEVGPGLGAFAEVCGQANRGYWALEPNPRMCQQLRRRGHRVIGGLAPPIPLVADCVEVVHAAHVIEHSPTFREAMWFIDECQRVVVEGGLVSLVAPDFDHLGNEFYRAHYSHSLPINMRRLKQLVIDNGLSVCHSSFLSGPIAGPFRWLTQGLARLSTARLIWLLTIGTLRMEQCYSAKMTFMRAVWIVGRKERG